MLFYKNELCQLPTYQQALLLLVCLNINNNNTRDNVDNSSLESFFRIVTEHFSGELDNCFYDLEKEEQLSDFFENLFSFHTKSF